MESTPRFNRKGISADPDDPNRFVVPELSHMKLAKHAKVLAALRDPKLQKILLEVDMADDREVALEKKLKIPRFRDFMDMCLLGVGLARNRDDGNVEFVG